MKIWKRFRAWLAGVDTGGRVSDPSNEACKSVTAPPDNATDLTVQ